MCPGTLQTLYRNGLRNMTKSSGYRLGLQIRAYTVYTACIGTSGVGTEGWGGAGDSLGTEWRKSRKPQADGQMDGAALEVDLTVR